MNKKLKYIKENTEYIEAKQLYSVRMTDTYQIECRFAEKDKTDNLLWNGEIQKIYLDKDGEAKGYDVYIY